MVFELNEKEIWIEIEKEIGVSKKEFGKKISFIKDKYMRIVIFRDISHAYYMKKAGLSKPAVIISGGVIEELLKEYLKSKGITDIGKTFNDYIKKCEEKGLLKGVINKLTESVREFRNMVHLEKEISKRFSISKATANIAVASIFTICNDFQ